MRRMTPRGFEPLDASALPSNDLKQLQQVGAAKSGAVNVETVLALLAALSEEDRERLRTLLNDDARPD
jgi:hypothetical protein